MKEGETFSQVYTGGMSVSEICELFPNEKLAERWRSVLKMLEFIEYFDEIGVKGNKIKVKVYKSEIVINIFGPQNMAQDGN